MLIDKKRFFYLLESKLGDVKPLVLEQPDSKMPWQIEKFGYSYDKPETFGPALKRQQEFLKEIDPHSQLVIASIATAFIPLIGPFISSGLMLADAALYASEGDTKNAGLNFMFALLPGVGSVIRKIPVIDRLGKKGMQVLSNKLINNTRLSQIESEVINSIKNNKEFIYQELSKYISQTAKNAAKRTKDVVLKNKLSEIAKKGLQYTGKAVAKTTKVGAKLATSITPYVAADYAYNKTYDKLQSNTPEIETKNDEWNWSTLKLAFGSSGSAEENIMLQKAYREGWRPGDVVPEKFRTELYKKNYEKELQDFKKLASLVNNSNNIDTENQ